MSEHPSSPAPLPPAAQSPYPAHPAPHPHAPAPPPPPHIPAPHRAERMMTPAGEHPKPKPGNVLRTVALIGTGFVAAGVGFALLLPRLRPKPDPKRKAKRGKGGKRR